MNEVVQRLRCRGFTWLVAGEEGRALVTGRGPDLARLSEASAQRIKTSWVRTVWVLPHLSAGESADLGPQKPIGLKDTLRWAETPERVLPGYYVKDYHARGAGERLRALVRCSRAMTEWRVGRRLLAADIPTYEVLAVGQARRFGLVARSILVTRAIERAAPLADLLVPGRLGMAGRRRLIAAFAQLVRRLHEAGVDHRDPHAGNFLVTGLETGRPVVHLIDLHHARLSAGGGFGRRARLRGLSRLWAAFHGLTSRQDRLRFFRAYVAGRKDLVRAAPSLIRAAVDGGRREVRRLWRRRDRRCRKPGWHFIRIWNWRVKALAVAELNQPLHRRWLEDPDALLQGECVEVVKADEAAEVARVDLRGEVGARPVYVKRFRPRKWRRRLRRSRAMKAWRLGHAMLNRGLPTPRPLAAVNRREWGPFARSSYLITEAVSGAASLYDLLRGPETPPAQKRALASAMGSLLARMHERGFSHRDLKLINVLARLSEGGLGPPGPALWVIDLDGARQYRGAVSPRRRVRDLARLLVAVRRFERQHPGAVGAEGCRAFLDAYLGPSVGAAGRAQWCRRAASRAARLATERRKRRRRAWAWLSRQPYGGQPST